MTRNKIGPDVAVVYSVPEDKIGNGIWGVFSTHTKAVGALRQAGLRAYDPYAHNADDPEKETPRDPDERVIGFIGVDFRPTMSMPPVPGGDPILGAEGYPHDIELERIADWPTDNVKGLPALLDYVKRRWKYPDYWSEEEIIRHDRRYLVITASTGGWSGNEDLVAALEENIMFRALAPQKWERGGHYVWEVPLWDSE